MYIAGTLIKSLKMNTVILRYTYLYKRQYFALSANNIRFCFKIPFVLCLSSYIDNVTYKTNSIMAIGNEM